MKYILILAIAVVGLAMAAPASLAKDCPPGLAKKNPPCVPPGLAKKSHKGGSDRRVEKSRTFEDEIEYVIARDGTVYRVGDPIDYEDYTILLEDDFRRLPPAPDGYTYILVDDRIVEVVAATRLYIRTIGLVADLLN